MKTSLIILIVLMTALIIASLCWGLEADSIVVSLAVLIVSLLVVEYTPEREEEDEEIPPGTENRSISQTSTEDGSGKVRITEGIRKYSHHQSGN